MKKLFNSIFVIIAAMVTFVGCLKEEVAAPETKTVHFIAESIETKTAFGTPDGTTYPTLWTENDRELKVLINLNEESTAPIVVSDDFKTAEINAEFKLDEDSPSLAPFTFYALSPASAYLGKTAERFAATIPNSQTPLENSVDEAAQILYAVSNSYDEFPSEVALHFRHFTAYGKLSFKNLDLDGAKVESVALTSDSKIAGRWNYMIADGSFTENSGSNSITLNTSKTENIWFACAPVDVSNTTLKVAINTDKGQLVKEVNIPAGHKFEAGKIAKFSVDMQGVTFGKDVVYERISNVSELLPNSEIIIVAAESAYALSTTQNTNNRGQASITKSTDLLTITNPGDDVQILTVEDGKVAGTVAFYTGTGYLYAAHSSSNHLKTQTTLDANGSWLVEVVDGVASIVAQGSYTRNVLQHNLTSGLFSCYSSASQKQVSIYKRQDTGSHENYLRVSPAAIAVKADETSATFTVSSDLEWTATPSAGATVTTEGNTVTVSFAANTEESEKTYTVTVSANGVEPQTVTITQAKKIAKTQLTVAEFKELLDGADLYELTGTIAGIKDSYNSQYNNISFYLEDETGRITIYRMSCSGIDPTKVIVGNTITVKGSKGSYGTESQMAQGGTCLSIVEVVTPAPTITFEENIVSITAVEGADIYFTVDGTTPTVDEDLLYDEPYEIEETCTVKAIAVKNGLLKSSVVEWYCEIEEGGEDNRTIEELNIYANKGTLSSDKSSISWTGSNFKITSFKDKSSTAIRTSDSDHFRVYQGAKLTFIATEKSFTKVVVTCTSSAYANVLKESAQTAGYTASVSDAVVTIICETAVSEIAVSASAQFRINKVEATLK